MSRHLFPGSPFFLGFDEIERLVEFASRNAAESYPPLNIEQYEDGGLRITIAVAGFAPENLSVTVCDRELTVKGDRTPPSDRKAYLHTGIAARSFTKSFALASSLEVVSATLANGLLRVNLKQIQKAPEIRQIPITTG